MALCANAKSRPELHPARQAPQGLLCNTGRGAAIQVLVSALHNPRPISSSRPPQFADEQVALYRDVLDALNRENVRYAVSGAFAFHQHTGIWRDTKDLDLFLETSEANRALACLRQRGLHCEITEPVWLAKAHRANYYVDLITGMSNGILRVDRCWIARSLPCAFFGSSTRVLAAEELLASKLFVFFRERFDGSDVAHIIYRANGLDWERILQLAGEHRGLLFASLALYRYIYPAALDRVPAEIWQRLSDELRDELRRPHPQQDFHGTLLDEKMFAVDVDEWKLPDPLRASRARLHEFIEFPQDGASPRRKD